MNISYSFEINYDIRSYTLSFPSQFPGNKTDQNSRGAVPRQDKLAVRCEGKRAAQGVDCNGYLFTQVPPFRASAPLAAAEGLRLCPSLGLALSHMTPSCTGDHLFPGGSPCQRRDWLVAASLLKTESLSL